MKKKSPGFKTRALFFHTHRPPPIFLPVLCIPGLIYQAGVYLRNRAFDAGFIPARSLMRPVVSVGNLTLGGTGKTPFVIYLAGLIKEMGCETAVLTRGYGRRESEKTVVLPPGENDGFSASLIGDEPALMRRHLPEAWLGISSNRVCAANAIARRCGRTDRMVFILDDGFQRRGIRRDLDIVMIDPTLPPDKERLFPMGGLREPAAELRRARIIVINGAGSSGALETRSANVETIMKTLRKYAPDAEYFHCVQRIQTIVPFYAWLDSGTQNNLAERPGTAFLVAAIGNPDRFRQDIINIGIETPGCAFFRDHAEISKNDWEICVKAARDAKAEAIIITEKDAVKISSQPDYPLLVAVQNTELVEAASFREILQRCVQVSPNCL